MKTLLGACLTLGFLLTACEDDGGASAIDAAREAPPSQVDAPIETVPSADGPGVEVAGGEAGSEAGGEVAGEAGGEAGAEAGSCSAGLVLRFTSAGCGASAPAPVCGSPTMDACGGHNLCACDGTVIETCEGWATRAWAYRLPGTAAPASCDPLMMPDGGRD